jgi:hypothetical protein
MPLDASADKRPTSPPAGKPDVGDRTPSGFLHLRTLDALLSECRYLGLQIVTHEIEFVPRDGDLLTGRLFCAELFHFDDRQSLRETAGGPLRAVGIVPSP